VAPFTCDQFAGTLSCRKLAGDCVRHSAAGGSTFTVRAVVEVGVLPVLCCPLAICSAVYDGPAFLSRACISGNWLESAFPCTFRDSASFVIALYRFPGFGWLLSHSMPPPPPSASMVLNMLAISRGS
jgi:hypothetical protein